ncbi:hypothetical protein BD769DRAFT_1393097 [Suillus cothurnatus]|nr:hypothetical protein BD769DRAFT_1393097 [Suillus cothurnatus]
MCNTMKPVSSFYNQEPGAPPPFPPMLTDQLELFENSPSQASTIVPPIPAPKGMPETTLAAPSSKTNCCFLPYQKRVSPEQFFPWSPIYSDSSNSIDLVLDSGLSTSAMSQSEDSKIPKPPGKPSHPGQGGYTLQESLNWSPKAYTKSKAVDTFPDLDNYSGCWPVNDIIMMHLKYMLGHARQKEAGMTLGKR